MTRKTLLSILLGLFLALVCTVVVIRVSRSSGTLFNLLWRLELTSYDARLSHRASRFPDDIVVVAIDDESLQQIGVWPWPRSTHAQLINRLSKAGAKLIGMDTLLAEPSGAEQVFNRGTGQYETVPAVSDADRQLAAAIRKSHRVVLASEIVNELTTRGDAAASGVESAVVPYDIFAEGMLDTGVANIPCDLDSVVRRAWLALRHQDEDCPSLAVALAAAALKRTPKQVIETALREGTASTPFLEGNTILLNYCGPAGTIEHVPYYQVLRGMVPSTKFRNKIVLVGASADILHDVHNTPMARLEPGQVARLAPMPGVEVQANVLDMLLRGVYLRPAPLSWLWELCLLLALIVAESTILLRPLRGGVVLMVVLVGVVAGTTMLLLRHDLWLPLVPLALAPLLSFLTGTIYMYFAEERARLKMRRAWQQRVSAEVLHVILNNPVHKVVGRNINATVMFTDLRGFTTMCHAYPPEVVVERLNEYLTAMTEVIREYGGTIHKFIGDGIMAVFGDPVAHANHAERAVRASIVMQQRMAALSEAAIAAGDAPLRMGVGLHTGELVAGDIGSEALLEYTVIGDTVSTASRIEGLNKDHKTGILISGQTRAALGATDLQLRHVATQSVRGRDEDLELYTVDEAPPDAAATS